MLQWFSFSNILHHTPPSSHRNRKVHNYTDNWNWKREKKDLFKKKNPYLYHVTKISNSDLFSWSMTSRNKGSTVTWLSTCTLNLWSHHRTLAAPSIFTSESRIISRLPTSDRNFLAWLASCSPLNRAGSRSNWQDLGGWEPAFTGAEPRSEPP